MKHDVSWSHGADHVADIYKTTTFTNYHKNRYNYGLYTAKCVMQCSIRDMHICIKEMFR